MPSYNFIKNSWLWVAALWLLAVVPAIPWVRSYLQPELSLWLALMLTPFVLVPQDAGMRSWRYGWIGLVGLGLHGLLGNNLWLWVSLGSCLLLLVEQLRGKVGYLPLVWLGLLSPIVGGWMEAFSFPLRLWQSEQVAKWLSWVGMAVEVHGNRFAVNEQWFEVEAACLGVHTLTMSLIVTTFLLALGAQWRGRSWHLVELIGWYLLAIGLGVFANFARMIWLVLLKAPVATLSHELIGLLAIGSLVGLPLYVTMRIRARNSGSSPAAASPHLPFPTFTRNRILLLAACCLTVGLRISQHYAGAQRASFAPRVTCKLDELGVATHPLANDVTQYRREDLLIYLKSPCAPWRADHTPQVCWRGAGYAFRHITPQIVQGIPVLTATLVQQQDTLHTIWWYDNGQEVTDSQWKWRQMRTQGAPAFYLCNTTAKTLEEALAAVPLVHQALEACACRDASDGR